jgi:drug/metabolite transporter (DMT)-like permease
MTTFTDYLNHPEHRKKILGGLCSLTVSFTFCLHFFVAKDVMKAVPPIVLGGFRGVLGGLLLFMFYFSDLKGNFTLKNLKMLLSIAFFGYFINQILFLNGLKLSTPLNTGVIMNTIPVVAALISMLFRVEIFAWRKLIGCFLGFSMILLLTLSSHDKHLSGAKIGDLLIFTSVITLCISTVLTKTLVKTGFPSPIISASMLFFGGLALCTLVTDQLGIIVDYAMQSEINLGKVIFEIVISTALTYLLSFKALKYLAPSQSMIFIYLQPLIIAGIDFLVFAKAPPFILIPVLLGVVFSGYLVMSTDSR